MGLSAQCAAMVKYALLSVLTEAGRHESSGLWVTGSGRLRSLANTLIQAEKATDVPNDFPCVCFKICPHICYCIPLSNAFISCSHRHTAHPYMRPSLAACYPLLHSHYSSRAFYIPCEMDLQTQHHLSSAQTACYQQKQTKTCVRPLM